jgi:hypothetical protein
MRHAIARHPALVLTDVRLLGFVAALILAVLAFAGGGEPAAAGWSTSPG